MVKWSTDIHWSTGYHWSSNVQEPETFESVITAFEAALEMAVPPTFPEVIISLETQEASHTIWNRDIWQLGIWECGKFCQAKKLLETHNT